ALFQDPEPTEGIIISELRTQAAEATTVTQLTNAVAFSDPETNQAADPTTSTQLTNAVAFSDSVTFQAEEAPTSTHLLNADNFSDSVTAVEAATFTLLSNTDTLSKSDNFQGDECQRSTDTDGYSFITKENETSSLLFTPVKLPHAVVYDEGSSILNDAESNHTEASTPLNSLSILNEYGSPSEDFMSNDLSNDVMGPTDNTDGNFFNIQTNNVRTSSLPNLSDDTRSDNVPNARRSLHFTDDRFVGSPENSERDLDEENVDISNTDGNFFNIQTNNVRTSSLSNLSDDTQSDNVPNARRSLHFTDDGFVGLPENSERVLDEENGGIPDNQLLNAEANLTPEATTTRRRYPQPEKLTRKRVANPYKWKKNEAQRKLASGQAHLSVKGVMRRQHTLQIGCDASCRNKCQEKVTPDERQDIFNQFWKIPTQKEKWDFIALHLEIQPVKNANDLTKRASSRKYFFRIDGEKVRVCKVMFLDTLDVCDSLVETTVKKLKMGGYISPDKRQRHHESSPKVLESRITVREHINSIPRMPSHYNREASNKEYITEHFQSVADMYGAYGEWMTLNHPEKTVASERQYRDVFNTEFNISFFLSKKDVCDECTTWLNTAEDNKDALQEKYSKHLENKNLVHEMVENDKKLARHKDSKTLCVAHFDYEKNLICPKADTSVFYYKRKLNVSNFTIVDVGRYEDNCYVYDETIGHKGSNEVASFLLHFIERKVAAGVKEFRFYSDNCGGQNKNRNVAALYAYAAAKYGISITHTFLEKGHTYNAADTVHSLIERKTKPLQIYSPRQWYQNIETAKRSKSHPLRVIEVTQEIIFQWNDLSNKLQLDKDVNRQAIPWRSIRQISSDSSTVHQLKFKTDFSVEPRVVSTKRVGKPVNFSTFKLEKLYNGPLPISKLKHADLQFYCSHNHIPIEFQAFYNDNKSSESVPDEVLETQPVGRARKRQEVTAKPRKTRKRAAEEPVTFSENEDDPH
ncbi:Neuraminidase, partial [Frankliniella fusca]